MRGWHQWTRPARSTSTYSAPSASTAEAVSCYDATMTAGYLPVNIGSRAFARAGCLDFARPGDLLSRDEIMRVAWPGTVVEESNLAVQISTLRRVLDAGTQGKSCIQTVSGRGYRFVPARVTRQGGCIACPRTSTGTTDATQPLSSGAPERASGGKSPPPRLSVAVLPFFNVDRTPVLTRLAIGLHEEVTVDLAQLWFAQVSARGAVLALSDQPVDVQMVGRALDVRYVLESSLRCHNDRLRVTAWLMSSETGKVLSLDEIDVITTVSTDIQDEIRGWMANFAGKQMTIAESIRSISERPDNPDAFDLLMQARAQFYQRSSAARSDKARTLYERALQLDPQSYRAMADLAAVICEQYTVLRRPATRADFILADRLMSAAEALAPTENVVLYSRADLLRHEQRWPEAIVAFEQLRSLYPYDDRAYFVLGICKQQVGQAEEAIRLFRTAIRLNPRTSNSWSRYSRLGQALALTEQYDEAVVWLQRVDAADPERPASQRCAGRLWLASAYALGGRIDRAGEEVEAARSIFPYYWSARSFMADQNANEGYTAQLDRIREGLRLAGLRDHVDEDAAGPHVVDPGLHPIVEGPTPRTIREACLVRTKEVAALLEGGRAVVVDAASGTRSIQDAISVAWIGHGGNLSDASQELLEHQLQVLTHGDKSRPVVTLGINAEHWGGYNLAVRAVALGYNNVLWYRGGRDAWAAAGLPVGPLKGSPHGARGEADA